MTAPRISTVMWPMQSWPEAGELWRRAEELGFRHAWVYDHIAWHGTTPWYDAYTTLAAAAAVTSRVRLGTLVTSPNFRHPVPTAHAIKTIDHVSGGRVTIGIGSGGTHRDSDAGILGGDDWTPGERADRFAEWVDLLGRLLRDPETTFEGTFYTAREVVEGPGCVQRPRVPFVIAGGGPRGMQLAALYGQGWVTCPSLDDSHAADEVLTLVKGQVGRLEQVCESLDRDPAELDKVYISGFTPEDPFTPGLLDRYAEAGITEFVVHWPVPDTRLAYDPALLERLLAPR